MAQNPRNSATRLVTLSAAARTDLADIQDSTADFWGDQQAEAYTTFLLDTAQHLADAPQSAPMVPERKGVRVFVARWKNARRGHRIFYKEMPQGIEIIRIIGTRMNWQKHLGNA
jgi:plasmid stabilization system protein ParE